MSVVSFQAVKVDQLDVVVYECRSLGEDLMLCNSEKDVMHLSSHS